MSAIVQVFVLMRNVGKDLEYGGVRVGAAVLWACRERERDQRSMRFVVELEKKMEKEREINHSRARSRWVG